MPPSSSASSAAKIPYVIEEGERAAEEQLPYLRRLLAARDRVPNGSVPNGAAPNGAS